ncbi:hypothetical protein JOE49_004005 [Paenibacillus sp. PvR133]|uniref:hypothetical protein n=1 Tax=Paenibacillus sp. PvR133 TaxID=2806598 RepID=UPI001AEB7391|nr:hypothetical protein [Paenibacillus sp. PvR133]MBP1176753.1 hypothetical protein [Paenibacillus sp. PvR133]
MSQAQQIQGRKVKIISSNHLRNWYADKIGQEFIAHSHCSRNKDNIIVRTTIAQAGWKYGWIRSKDYVFVDQNLASQGGGKGEYQYVIDTLRAAKTVFVAQDKDGIGLAIDPNNAIDLIDSLQQQTVEYRMTIERQGQEMIRLQGLVNKHLQEVGHLCEQIAERDRKITWLTNELGE